MKTTDYGVLDVDIKDLTPKQIKEINEADWFAPKENEKVVIVDKRYLTVKTKIFFERDAIDYGIKHPEQNRLLFGSQKGKLESRKTT